MIPTHAVTYQIAKLERIEGDSLTTKRGVGNESVPTGLLVRDIEAAKATDELDQIMNQKVKTVEKVTERVIDDDEGEFEESKKSGIKHSNISVEQESPQVICKRRYTRNKTFGTLGKVSEFADFA